MPKHSKNSTIWNLILKNRPFWGCFCLGTRIVRRFFFGNPVPFQKTKHFGRNLSVIWHHVISHIKIKLEQIGRTVVRQEFDVNSLNYRHENNMILSSPTQKKPPNPTIPYPHPPQKNPPHDDSNISNWCVRFQGSHLELCQHFPSLKRCLLCNPYGHSKPKESLDLLCRSKKNWWQGPTNRIIHIILICLNEWSAVDIIQNVNIYI